jgi:hypothetical protein
MATMTCTVCKVTHNDGFQWEQHLLSNTHHEHMRIYEDGMLAGKYQAEKEYEKRLADFDKSVTEDERADKDTIAAQAAENAKLREALRGLQYKLAARGYVDTAGAINKILDGQK